MEVLFQMSFDRIRNVFFILIQETLFHVEIEQTKSEK